MNSNNPVCVRSHEIKSEMTDHIFTTATAASLWFMLKTRVHHFNSHFHMNLHCHFESLPQHVLNLFRMIGKDFFFTGQMPFLSPSQQYQSTEGREPEAITPVMKSLPGCTLPCPQNDSRRIGCHATVSREFVQLLAAVHYAVLLSAKVNVEDIINSDSSNKQ